MSDLELSIDVYDLAREPAELKVFLAEYPEVKVDLYKTDHRETALLYASRTRVHQLTDSVQLLLDNKADVNAQTTAGWTSLVSACYTCKDETALVLLERGADVHIKSIYGSDVLFCVLYRRVKSNVNALMTFVLLCCGADAKNVHMDGYITEATVDVIVDEYEETQAFIENNHELLEHTLSNLVEVDTRMGLRSTGIYHEPLERTLEYLGLSMNPDQVVNTSIDGNTPMRVLIPHQPRNAKHWQEKHRAWMNLQQYLQQHEELQTES
jgi:hypothetical protein